MATSKTLTPTNVTIQIPDFTDQPDQRVNSNCIDKEADAINALNGKSMSALVNGSNQGYVSFANGFMMQWGKAVIPIGSDRVQVNFNPYYDHHIPMVTFTPEENGNAAGAVSDLRVFDTSYTKFVVYNKNGSVTSKDIIVNWIAIGTWSNI